MTTGTGNAGHWADLTHRVASAAVLLLIAAALLLAPVPWLRPFVALLTGATFWELARMTGRPASPVPGMAGDRMRPVLLGALAAVCLHLALIWDWSGAVCVLVVPALVSLHGTPAQRQVTQGLFAVAILLVGYQLVGLRTAFGADFLLWLMGVVILSDTLGYFAGRILGGPKFWPRISPRKTWSGTVAGWVGAVLWGVGFGLVTGKPALMLALAGLPVCLAGQMGDIAESWLKRRAGVKDSSNLIPGHGGLMDRFDALSGAVLAASVMVLLGWPGAAPGGW